MTEQALRQIIREEAGIRPELLMLKDVATMLNISLPSARKLRDTGAIPFYLLAGKRMFKRKDVMDYIERLPKGSIEDGSKKRSTQAQETPAQALGA